MILPLLLDRSPTFCSLKFRFLALLFKIFWGITKMWHKIITFDSLYCHCSVVQLCLTLGYPMDCRLPCPSPSPRACSNSCPLSLWCHPTISPSVVPFSSCPQSLPASRSLTALKEGARLASPAAIPAAVGTEAFGPLAVPVAHLIPYESCDKSWNYGFCFKPVHLGMVCEAAVGNWRIVNQKAIHYPETTMWHCYLKTKLFNVELSRFGLL